MTNEVLTNSKDMIKYILNKTNEKSLSLKIDNLIKQCYYNIFEYEKKEVVYSVSIYQFLQEFHNYCIERELRSIFSRTRAAIVRYNKIEYLGELLSMTESDLLKTSNFGRKSLNLLNDFLQNHFSINGLSFGMRFDKIIIEKHKQLKLKKYLTNK